MKIQLKEAELCSRSQEDLKLSTVEETHCRAGIYNFSAMRLIFVSFVAILLSTAASAADQGLDLKSYSEEQVEGCYIHNQTLGVCFDISKGFMKLLKTTGEQIVLYKELGPELLFYQVLDQAFIGYNNSLFYVSNNVSLQDFLGRFSENLTAEHEALKTRYQEAMSELHYVPQVQLLERVSAALADNSTRLEILQPFHFFCLNLLKASDVEIPDELKAADGTDEDTAGERQKRSCERPKANDCRGLCGKGCSCWWWVCRNCCWNRGCHEHDLCCKESYINPRCWLLVFYGFTCSGYAGYPACLN